MFANTLPTDLNACHTMLNEQQSQLERHTSELSLKTKLVEEQAHSVLQLKEDNDRLDLELTELKLIVEKLTKQIYSRNGDLGKKTILGYPCRK